MTRPGGNVPHYEPLTVTARRVEDLARDVRELAAQALTAGAFSAAPTWQTPTYGTGWSDYTAGGFAPLRYQLLTSGLVRVSGSCVAANPSAAQTIFTLPAGFRPAATHAFAGVANNGAGDVFCYVRVKADGSVRPQVIGTTYVAVEVTFYPEG